MDRAKRTVAASAVALTAFMLVGGPTVAVAEARPGDSGGHSGADRGGHRADHGGKTATDRAGKPAADPGSKTPTEPGSNAGAGMESPAPQVTVGSGRSPSAGTVSKSASAIGSSGSKRSSGSAAAPVFVAPKVTFGNGRHPAPGSPVPAAPPQTGVTVPPPAAVTPEPGPEPAPAGIPRPAVHPSAVVDLSALHPLDTTRPGQPMTSWFGLAGLLLIPLAGAALGYRQARAARAAANLVVR